MRESADGLRLAAGRDDRDALESTRRLRYWLRDRARRLRGRAEAKLIDRELAQLRSVRRAHRVRRSPAVLALGDSAMFFVPREDEDKRRLDDMVRDGLAERPHVVTVAGPAYNPRVFAPILAAIDRSPWRPNFVFLALSAATFTDLRLSHPTGGYETASSDMRDVAERGGRSRRLTRPSADVEDAYDRLLTPSLIGPPRLVAEVRLLTNAVPATPHQAALRSDLLLDSYLAQRFEPANLGPTLLEGLGRDLARMRLPSLLCMVPMNYERAESLFGEPAAALLRHNADVLAAAFRAGAGDYAEVLDATFLCPAGEFADPLHLNDRGRRRLAAHIGPVLASSSGSGLNSVR